MQRGYKTSLIFQQSYYQATWERNPGHTYCIPTVQPTIPNKSFRGKDKPLKENTQTHLINRLPLKEQRTRMMINKVKPVNRQNKQEFVKRGGNQHRDMMYRMPKQVRLPSYQHLEKSQKTKKPELTRSQVRSIRQQTQSSTIQKANGKQFTVQVSQYVPAHEEHRVQFKRIKALSRLVREPIDQLECEQDFTTIRKLSNRKVHTRKQSQAPAPSLLSAQQQIKRFESEEELINRQFGSESLSELIRRETEYQSLPHFSNYLQVKQRHINWIKRAVLLNWMMEFMVDYMGRRETLYLAASIVDRYLCRVEHCPLNRLQLVGITGLFVATKMEQSSRPALSSFAESTSGVFGEQDIGEMEEEMLGCLGWEINSPTLGTWCLRLTVQWDLYIKKEGLDLFVSQNADTITFKNSDQKSYYNYRWLVQLLDLALLDIHTIRYKSRAVVASFMYLVLGLRTGQFNQSDVVENFPTSSLYLVDKNITLNETFNNFIKFSFQIMLCDLHPTIQYCASYFILPLTFQLPQKVKEDKEIGYQQFCSYQTVNKHNIYCLQKRNRDFD